MYNRILTKDIVAKSGEKVTLCGWVFARRDHGKIAFIDLWDRSGIAQCVGSPENKGCEDLSQLRTGWVVKIEGSVKDRPAKMVNPNLATGSVEVEIRELEVLSRAQALPFPYDDDGYSIDENVRLKYRYLDMRRDRVQKVLRLRSKFIQALRAALFENDFMEVETPMLTKSTKEGARDFIVPSRLNPGKFYALPQSPQQYKQLLMVGGVERYFQIARCIRDEDLRADRGFEFTQLDLEMSFVEQQDVMAMVEKTVKKALSEMGAKIKENPFPIISYKDAMKKYGADKFDLRTEEEKKEGVLAFAWVIDFPFFKKVDKKDAAEVRDSKSGWTFTHNPFSQPTKQYIEQHLQGEKVGEILTTQYDLVCNGYEVGGGSIRAHDPKVLEATMRIMGYTGEQIQESMGHMLEAFKYGAPPHGGIALGLDRWIMLLSGEKSLREVVAFPMTAGGQTAVMDAPSEATKEQLDELGIQIKVKSANNESKRINE